MLILTQKTHVAFESLKYPRTVVWLVIVLVCVGAVAVERVTWRNVGSNVSTALLVLAGLSIMGLTVASVPWWQSVVPLVVWVSSLYVVT